ncbi:bifunctional indole-3-glycerol-phosphate synthase TrpC/phosphoribosylanthranilate isomerase TrpF [Orbus sturtevantii]|uniref:bifunctional indole-3-glycerol-phosphate synthase TrpC/phosphoribosylanthranilate isomerase TrpF n=1 Tax=Orbus sturtevantii TaxID=3074109 RepID=UPI00370D4195
MATVLKKIVTDKAIWLADRKVRQPLSTFKDNLAPSDRNFYHALTDSKSVFILECKKASPSKGLICHDFNPEEIAKIYGHHANAISVLTDEKYFQGSFDFLPIVKQHTHQPILCKDFIIDEYQVYLARYYQADAILLMLSVLNDDEYLVLSELAHSLNMGVLTEASTQHEVERAIQLNAKVIGINNRNLRDLTVDLDRVKQLAPQIPEDRIVISESGIYTHAQVLELSHYADGFLIGSALMSEDDLELAIRKVMLGENKVCGLTRKEDAFAAYQAGSVYGGLIFVQSSPRYIEPIKARTVMSGAKLNWVGVFKNEPLANVVNIATSLNLFAVQLHGDEDASYIADLRDKLPKPCQIWQAISIKAVIPTHNNPLVNRYLFDQGNGGTGKPFDWQLLVNQPLDNVMLAGGVNPQNAKQAIQTGVIGLDINSGVETSSGIKDHDKIKQLFSILSNYPY